jgi:hypothetical protein
MPPSDSGVELVAVSGDAGTVEARRLWRWLIGEQPLRGSGRKSLLEFIAATLPGWALDEMSVVESGIEPNVTTIVRKQSVIDGDDQ